MKKLLFLIMMCFMSIQIAHAEKLAMDKAVQFASGIDKALNYPEGNNVSTKYAKAPKELSEGFASNLQRFENNKEGKEVGSAMCIVHVLDNGNLALTFFSDEELQKFHEETDFILNKYYGGYDSTAFQHPSRDIQTHVTTMILKRIEKKKKFRFIK